MSETPAPVVGERRDVTSGTKTTRIRTAEDTETTDEVVETAAKHFATESDLVLVAVAAEPLGTALKWEPSRGGALFPHLYRPLTLADVAWDTSLPLGVSGHIFPEVLL